MSSSSSSSSSWSFSLLAVLRSAWCSYQNATTSTSRWALQLLLAFGAAIYTIYKITHHFYYLYANKYRRNINDIPLPIPPSVASKAEHTTPPSRHHTGLYYDYIIVGAGSAGCVLANRLSADPNNKVLLIEAGGDDSVLFAGIPVAAGKLQRGKHDWGYKTVPQKYSHNAMVDKRSNWPRGKIMGGCSTLNYMIWVRGDAEDYNTWLRMGCAGWSYDDVLPHFKSIENASNIGKHPLRGTEGEIHVNHLSSPNAGVDAFIRGCASIGIPSNPDYNAESMIGAAPIQTSTHHGWRWNGASAFIAPIMHRSNLTLLPWTHTTRLIFEGNRVTGVAIVRGKNEAELRACREMIIGANKEVIVCAGAIGSPHLLLLSGIGPREELQRQGIPCVADLPVGRNLQDHLCLPVPFESKIPSLSEAHIGLWDIWSYLRSGTGVLSSVFVEGTAFLRTGVRSDLPQPDLQYHFAPATLSAENWDNFNVKPEIRDKMLKAVPGFTQILAPTLIRPASVGTITLASPDPLIHPLIDPHYLEDKRDVDVLIAGCKIACRIAKTDAMQKVVGKLLLHVMDYGNPYNFETQEDQYWEYWVRFASATLYHPAGTCKMGAANDPTAVVTPDLRVKGIQGLRVADASIMPEVISGNTNAPSMMIGSKCAELIRLSTSVPIPPPSSATAPKRPVQVIQQSKL